MATEHDLGPLKSLSRYYAVGIGRTNFFIAKDLLDNGVVCLNDRHDVRLTLPEYLAQAFPCRHVAMNVTENNACAGLT
jgi:hypothetical protein